MKILTVDDSAFERKAIISILNKAGYDKIIEAEDGEKAVEIYPVEKPDLVLMDLRLPGMDGLECFKELKKINPTVKVIVVSIIAREDTMKEAKELGAKGYVIKPITEQKLITEIKKVMGG